MEILSLMLSIDLRGKPQPIGPAVIAKVGLSSLIHHQPGQIECFVAPRRWLAMGSASGSD